MRLFTSDFPMNAMFSRQFPTPNNDRDSGINDND